MLPERSFMRLVALGLAAPVVVLVGLPLNFPAGLALGVLWSGAGTAIYLALLAIRTPEQLRALRVAPVLIQTAAMGVALGLFFVVVASAPRGEFPWLRVLVVAVLYTAIRHGTEAALARWYRPEPKTA